MCNVFDPFPPGTIAVLLSGPCKGAVCRVRWSSLHEDGTRTYGIKISDEEFARVTAEFSSAEKKAARYWDEPRIVDQCALRLVSP